MCEVVIFYHTFQIVLKNLGQMLQQSKCTINIQNTLLSVNGPYTADLLLLIDICLMIWSYPAQFHPLNSCTLTEGRGEGTKVGNNTCRNEHIPHEIIIDVLQIVGCLCPSAFLSTESTNQFLGTFQFLTTQIHLLQKQRYPLEKE